MFPSIKTAAKSTSMLRHGIDKSSKFLWMSLGFKC